MKRYNPKQIEPKWQSVWEQTGIYKAIDFDKRPKSYVLDFFPYPSGNAMHIGHVRNYTISDALARYRRMKGMNVLHPMGWDSFGLPAENYAIKTGISPRQAIDENTKKFKHQLQMLGFSYDWSREIDSSDERYYKWTQYFFLLLFKRGLAYQDESLQWWCETDKTVLANEQVIDGKCWRCGNEVIKKPLKQWFFKITAYADRLLGGLDDLDWPDAIKAMQRNWIGRSEGLEIDFPLKGSDQKITVFTTRPDTIFGATFMVLAPEHPLAKAIATASQKKVVEDYINESLKKSDIERQDENREKTGVFTGAYAINPLTKEEIPVWISDFVLGGYGTGAIMAVPSNDQRDYEFAQKFNLPIKEIIKEQTKDKKRVFGVEGTLINSGKYSGMASQEAREKIAKELIELGLAREKVNYKMRDWLISRQRYWGAPIPIVHCPKCGVVPVPESELPVRLPEIDDYEPTGDGRSPLAKVKEFVNTQCPKCKGPAERETDTMDGFACSSWYFLRFADPHNDQQPFERKKVDYWLPVDTYIGGAEHAVMHLLYARFWTKVIHDAGLIGFDEPFISLRNQGMLLAADGSKISKSKGNVITPDELIEQGYGADSLRMFELFIAPYDQSTPWSDEGLAGTYRFLQRVWTLVNEFTASINEPQKEVDNLSELELKLDIEVNKTIKKVTQDLEKMRFNTAISALMALTNTYYKAKINLPFAAAKEKWEQNILILLQLLAPFAPHMTEELWHELGQDKSIHISNWPLWKEELVEDEIITIVIQVNGKLRGELQVPKDEKMDEIIDQAKKLPSVAKYLDGKKIKKTIKVPNRLINFVV